MASTIYSYPLTDNNRTGTFLTFTSYEYKTATSQKKFTTSEVGKALGQASIDLQNGVNTNNPQNQQQGLIEKALTGLKDFADNTLQKVDKSVTPKTQPTESINLYLPPKLEYQYSANWQKVQLGALGAGTSLAGAAGAGVGVGANSLFNSLSGLLSNVPKLENLSLDSILGATLGISFNDNTVQTFDKMNPRNFSFEYIMVARNQKEQQVIQAIIRSFKLGMHPTETENGENKGLFLGYPLVWQIQPSGINAKFKIRDRNGLITENNLGEKLLKFLPKTDLCALTDVKVDYTPENNIALLRGGFVQAVRLSLSFTELITLTRQDLAELEGV